jgi:hypothetical protein
MAVFLLPLVAAIVIYQYRSHDAVDILAVTDGQIAATIPEGIQVDAPLRAVVSEDRRTVAYVGHRGNEQCICINGSVSRCANEIGTIVISGDGSRVAWAEAKRNPLTDQVKWHVVADGSDGPEYQEIRNLQMAAGRGRVAYLAHSEKGWHFVFGGSTSPAYASIPWSALSPDGARSFYAAFVDNRLIPFLDGAAGPPFDQGFAYSFSANGRHFAYLGRDTDGKFLMVDGQRTQASSELSDVTLNADGSRLLRTMKSPAGVWFTEGDRSSPVFRTQQAGVMFTRSSGDIFVSVITAGTPSFQEQIWRSDNVTKLRRSRSSELVTRYRNEWLRTMRVDRKSVV